MGIIRTAQFLCLISYLGLIGCASIIDPCAYYVGKNDDKAIEECTNTFGNKYGPYVYNNRGAAYLNKGIIDLAMTDFNAAIELDPELAIAYYNRGRANLLLRRYDLALADYDEAMKLDSRFKDPSQYNTLNNEIIRAVLAQLTSEQTVLRLAIIVGAVNNVHNIPNMKEWKDGIKALLVTHQEGYYLATLRKDPRFCLISRNKIDEVLTEQTLQNLGLTSTSVELGQMIGATHLLIIDFSRYSSQNKANRYEDVVTYTLLEVRTGRTIASQVVRATGM